LVWFAALLLYHLSALRKDGAAAADTLEEKQREFKLVALDDGGGFAESVRAAFSKHAPKLSLTMVNVNEIPADLQADAVVLSGALALNPPEKAEAWIRSFNGVRFIVEEDLAGVAWMNDLGQAAASAKAMAEGQKVRPRASLTKGASAWTYIAYVFAALFALQLLFMLTMLGVSMVTGF